MFAISVQHFTQLPRATTLFSSMISALLLLLFGTTSYNANAVFIDFDDIAALPAEPFTGCGCGHVLSNEYESQGLVFYGDRNWLVGSTLPDGTNSNGVAGFNSISFGFVGALPNFISFNLHSSHEDASFTDVYGENGYLFTHIGSGWRGTEEDSTPYTPGGLVSFTSNEGITRVHISTLFGLRTGPYIDNLTFESATVPEPSPLVLLVTALAGLFWRRIKQRSTKR